MINLQKNREVLLIWKENYGGNPYFEYIQNFSELIWLKEVKELYHEAERGEGI